MGLGEQGLNESPDHSMWGTSFVISEAAAAVLHFALLCFHLACLMVCCRNLLLAVT